MRQDPSKFSLIINDLGAKPQQSIHMSPLVQIAHDSVSVTDDAISNFSFTNLNLIYYSINID